MAVKVVVALVAVASVLVESVRTKFLWTWVLALALALAADVVAVGPLGIQQWGAKQQCLV